ncbi:MAG: hypothetical protein JXB26_12545 [Candidatus Aminicenantes bacterium]|nr:hypothetical protein [Candidatus Aminicenantes bacterium]
MRRFLDLLKPLEKRILFASAFLCGAGILFLSVFSLPRLKELSRVQETLSGKERELRLVMRRCEEKRRQWSMWENTEGVMEDLRKERLYAVNEGPKQFRLDLQLLFNEAGLQVSGMMNYDYLEYEKEKIRKVSISFPLQGTYEVLKRFLYSVEKSSKFIHVERIDFLDIDPNRGILRLKISVAGYYAL